jgi:hypothetical protein
MHYCLSSQVDSSYLKQVDEVKIKYKELKKIFDFYEINPNLIFIIRITA